MVVRCLLYLSLLFQALAHPYDSRADPAGLVFATATGAALSVSDRNGTIDTSFQPTTNRSTPFLGLDATVLIVNFCTGPFDGAGAVVEVQVGGEFRVLARFQWPSEVAVGCGVQLQPEWTKSHTGHSVIFQFNWGYSIEVTRDGVVSERAAPDAPRLFAGFISYVDDAETTAHRRFLGLSAHVTESPHFCDNGCFGLGVQRLDLDTHAYIAAVPYRAAMNVARHFAPSSGSYFFQGSYPLIQDGGIRTHCSPVDTDLCLVELAPNGEVVGSRGPLGATLYRYVTKGRRAETEGKTETESDDDDHVVTAFGFGFPTECGEYNYGFATVDLDSATYQFKACLQPGVVVRTMPSTSDFNPDQTLFSQANGNQYTRLQLLVAEVDTGRVLLQSDLPGLAEALGVDPDMPFIGVWFAGYLA